MTEAYFNLTNSTNFTTLFIENETAHSNDDLQHFVSIAVFILFSFFFVAGLIGNGLVVIGKVIKTSSKKIIHCDVFVSC